MSQVLEYHGKLNILDQKETVFSISEKFKTRIFPYSVNTIFDAKENIILFFLRTKRSKFSVLQISCKFCKNQRNVTFLPKYCVLKDLLLDMNSF